MQAQTQQSKLADAIAAELIQESEATRRLLEIVPEEKLTWRPHPKAMSLGQLALHIAGTPGGVAEGTLADSSDVADFVHTEPASLAEVLTKFEDGLKQAREIVSATTDERALAEWKLVAGEKTVLAMPRIAFWRTVMLNHLYHHRGQLSTYLRMLDVPLPSIYGPSADTNPMA